MSRAFILPDLGEGLTEAAVVAWLVAPGDEVAVDQPVVELESAKSVVQLPTPYAGVVESLGGEVGDVLHAGTVLLTLSGGGESGRPAGPGSVDAAPADAGSSRAGVSDAAAPAGAPVSAPTGTGDPAPQAEGPTAPSGHVDAEESGAVLIGYGTRQSAATKRDAAAPTRFGRARPSAAPKQTPPAGLQSGRRSPVVSPIVRRIARDHGFDASELLGSGPDGLVARSDVEAFIREQAGAATSGGAPQAVGTPPGQIAEPETRLAPAVTTAGPRAAAGEHRVPLDRLARAAAAHFTRSRRDIPEATVWMDVDATELLAARRQLQEATGEKFGVTALVARFVVAGLARHPALNASFDVERDELILHDAVNLGLAAQTPRGLLVPVVHGAERMSLRELRDAVGQRTEQAATGAFAPDALSGGTFTFNNYGTLGVDGSAAIINHPEAAMLGIGRLVERPWVVNGAIAVRTVTELTLSFDHRVCDGAEAAAFLTFVARCIERPISLLADL
jgi:pyruvate/2-oxoglutarate dehydrogenase complex dihydrolipoamide acyltransferase (E2) component